MTTGEKTIDIQEMIGEVTSVSGNGFKIDAAPGDWINLSKFGPDLRLPDKGAMVKVEVTAGARGGYWLQGWAPLDAADPPHNTTPVKSSGVDEFMAELQSPVLEAQSSIPLPLRDDRPVVTRLAVLNSAIEYLNHFALADEPVTESRVLATAERFFQWAHGVHVSAAIGAGKPGEASEPKMPSELSDERHSPPRSS